MTYKQAIEYLYNSLPVFHHIGAAAYKPGLENSIQLMDFLDNPQNSYKTIHIAGTNGKGSTAHFLSAILQSAGYKTGLYTSPHLVDFEERIRVNGKKISKRYVSSFVEKNKNLLDKIQPSFFETTMALAFDYFGREHVDVAIIEVGLGGRLDSTNIITPVLSVITNIGFDHTEFLGDTLGKIAAEKAGIIKSGIPVVIGESVPETKKVFLEKAKNEKAPVSFAENVYQTEKINILNDKMIVRNKQFGEFTVGLVGNYQLKNIDTVLLAVKNLRENGFRIDDNAVYDGFQKVIQLTGLQGRWQILQKKPTVVADTGHNKEGIMHVAKQLQQQDFEKMHIVIGMVKDKDVSGTLSLLPKNATYYFTNANISRALKAEDLRKQAQTFQLQGNSYPAVKAAVKAAVKTASAKDFIFIGGSNFVVGEALTLFKKKK